MRSSTRAARRASLLGLAFVAAPLQIAAAQPTCTAERVNLLLDGTARIESAAHISATELIPAHCSVTGYIEHGSRIGFKLGLPAEWNNKFLFLGIGGFAGVFDPLDRGLAKGYATATTDTGHKGRSLEDATWALNSPAAVINHYESSVEVSARALKMLTAAYYGSAPRYAYFDGCSAGGRQGIVQAQRYPGTFDGIIAAAPAWNYTKLLTSFVENGKQILRSADRWVPPETFAQIDRAVLEQCDGLDGVEDGMVGDPHLCKVDLSPLLCKPGDRNASCLTPVQLETLQRLIEPKHAKKESGYFGFRLSGGDRGGTSWGWPEYIFGTQRPLPDRSGRLQFPDGHGSGPLQFVLGEQFFRYIVMNDPAYDARDFYLKRDGASFERRLGELLNADDTDLGTFVRTGGKLLIWHGWADPAVPAEMSINLYMRILRDTRTVPGQPATDEAVRLFMVPGVQHCGGGSGLTHFDPLPALEHWVEQGRPPERIVAEQRPEGAAIRSRPLCPYPRRAHYQGTGKPDIADSFDCRLP